MMIEAEVTCNHQATIQSLQKSITKIEKELSENLQLAVSTIEQVKNMFAKERAKF